MNQHNDAGGIVLALALGGGILWLASTGTLQKYFEQAWIWIQTAGGHQQQPLSQQVGAAIVGHGVNFVLPGFGSEANLGAGKMAQIGANTLQQWEQGLLKKVFG
jgi:hypothetical protein